MSASPASVLYRSAAQTDAKAQTQTRFKYLLPQDCPIRLAAYAFDVDYSMLFSSFGATAPAPQNKQHSASPFNGTDSNAILVGYSQPQDSGGGLFNFTASFARVPASWDDFVTANVTYPGWIDYPAAGDARSAITRQVTIRVHYDYYVLDPDSILATLGVLDSGGSAISLVASIGSIPVITRGQWLNTHISGGVRVPTPNSEVNDVVPAGGAVVGTTGYVETAPTLNNYILWCAVANAFKAGSVAWDATHPPAWDGVSTGSTYGQYVFQDSALSIYAGNIISRATSYALFQ